MWPDTREGPGTHRPSRGPSLLSPSPPTGRTDILTVHLCPRVEPDTTPGATDLSLSPTRVTPRLGRGVTSHLHQNHGVCRVHVVRPERLLVLSIHQNKTFNCPVFSEKQERFQNTKAQTRWSHRPPTPVSTGPSLRPNLYPQYAVNHTGTPEQG